MLCWGAITYNNTGSTYNDTTVSLPCAYSNSYKITIAYNTPGKSAGGTVMNYAFLGYSNKTLSSFCLTETPNSRSTGIDWITVGY